MTGLYIDTASHNIVADAYFFQVTPEHRASRRNVAEDMKFGVKACNVNLEQYKIWKASLPAMVERCRDWEHNEETCEYFREIPIDGSSETAWLCSCGRGKVKDDFLLVTEWAEFAPNVVRFALSPLFPAPFVEQTRKQSLFVYERNLEQVKEDIAENKACVACGKTGKTKKCGGCGKVYYCGKDCQRKHWKWHKPDCRPESSTPVPVR